MRLLFHGASQVMFGLRGTRIDLSGLSLPFYRLSLDFSLEESTGDKNSL